MARFVTVYTVLSSHPRAYPQMVCTEAGPHFTDHGGMEG